MRHKQLSTVLKANGARTFLSFVHLTRQAIRMDYTMYQMPHSLLKSPPILLMHGLGVSRAVWRRIARHLVKLGSRIVYTVDARNHGHSPHTRYHTPRHMAADVSAFVDHHRLNRVVALGHSMGGRALMTLALTQPRLVDRAIIVDITTGPVPEDVINADSIFELMLNIAPTIPRQYTLAEGRKYVLPAFRHLIRDDFDLMLLIHNLRKADDTGEFSWSVNPAAILDGWQDTIVNYESTLIGVEPYYGELLLIAANKDTFVTTDNIHSMRKYFPNLIVEYLDSHHTVHIDQPDEFVRLVVDFTQP